MNTNKHLNLVVYSGNVGGSLKVHETNNGVPACSFHLASDRSAHGNSITTWVKVNAYNNYLVESCKSGVSKGSFVLVIGELMNRDSKGVKDLVEVRARKVFCLNKEMLSLIKDNIHNMFDMGE